MLGQEERAMTKAKARPPRSAGTFATDRSIGVGLKLFALPKSVATDLRTMLADTHRELVFELLDAAVGDRFGHDVDARDRMTAAIAQMDLIEQLATWHDRHGKKSPGSKSRRA
jgi:hypothetical protein